MLGCSRRIEIVKANRIRSQRSFIVKETIKIKSKTKNKPKNEKQTNQTKNKAKKEWKQR